MAGMCCGMNISETETNSLAEPGSKSARRRRLEIHQFNFGPTDSAGGSGGGVTKRRRIDSLRPVSSAPGDWSSAARSFNGDEKAKEVVHQPAATTNGGAEPVPLDMTAAASGSEKGHVSSSVCPKFGMTSVCGRRRDMEDSVAIHPSFCGHDSDLRSGYHFFGVYDGHGCSHVATRCKDRMHEIMKDEFRHSHDSWGRTMSESFTKMDKDVTEWSSGAAASASASNCRCELQTQQCDAVGSTAVVAVVAPDKIIVSNCGDSRAVLCRNGVAIPLSVDHKPDRPDELNRIEESGGRVIFWDGARVLGVLAMSRAIGDNYLKPYVIPEPEVTITGRAEDDECLIIASDGLWDVVSNETACGVARMCLQSRRPPPPAPEIGNVAVAPAPGESSDQACSDASILLTKLALARHSTDNVSVVVVDLRKSP